MSGGMLAIETQMRLRQGWVSHQGFHRGHARSLLSARWSIASLKYKHHVFMFLSRMGTRQGSFKAKLLHKFKSQQPITPLPPLPWHGLFQS